MGDGFHNAAIHAEGIANEFLAIARHGAADNADAVAPQSVDFLQLLLHDFHRRAPVGGVIGIQNLVVPAQEHQLGGGAAAVDAQIRLARVGRNLPSGHVVFPMPGGEFRVLGLVFKQGLQVAPAGPHVFAPVEAGDQCVAIGFQPVFLGVHGRAQGHGEAAVFRETGVLLIQLQRLAKSLAQALAIIQGSPQKQHVSANAAALGKARDGLVHHGLINTGGHILLPRPLIQQGLNVRFGEHAAAGGDGIDAAMVQAERVQFSHGDVQKGGHLVDKRPGAAGAGAVHALINAAVKKDDLRVLAAQFDHAVGFRRLALHHLAGGEHFLHKRHLRRLRQPQARGAGNGHLDPFPANKLSYLFHQFPGPFPHPGEMPVIFLIDYLSTSHQYGLGRGGADIQSQKIHSAFLSQQILLHLFQALQKGGDLLFRKALRQALIDIFPLLPKGPGDFPGPLGQVQGAHAPVVLGVFPADQFLLFHQLQHLGGRGAGNAEFHFQIPLIHRVLPPAHQIGDNPQVGAGDDLSLAAAHLPFQAAHHQMIQRPQLNAHVFHKFAPLRVFCILKIVRHTTLSCQGNHVNS